MKRSAGRGYIILQLRSPADCDRIHDCRGAARLNPQPSTPRVDRPSLFSDGKFRISNLLSEETVHDFVQRNRQSCVLGYLSVLQNL